MGGNYSDDLERGIKLSFFTGFFAGILFSGALGALWYGGYGLFVVAMVPVIASFSILYRDIETETCHSEGSE